MPKILYIVYWGALEQLEQSFVIPAVKKLAQMGAEMMLMTFESHHQTMILLTKITKIVIVDKGCYH